MIKCHCAEVYFDEIVQLAIEKGKNYKEVMQELGASQICTACRADLISYCENKLTSYLEPA